MPGQYLLIFSGIPVGFEEFLIRMVEAFLGSRFHEVMEKIYKDLPFRKCSLDELLNFYEDDWDKNYHHKIVMPEI